MASISLPNFGLIGGGIAGFGAAAGDLVTQSGYYKAAEGYTKAGNMEYGVAQDYEQQGRIYQASGQIQLAQARRQLYKSESATTAAAGGAGLSMRGSMGDILRSSASQGALGQAIIGANVESEIESSKIAAGGAYAQAQTMYAESDQATSMGNAAGARSGFDMLGGIASMAGGIASMFL